MRIDGMRKKVFGALFFALLFLPLCVMAEEFTLQDMQGKTHHLSDYRGKWVLVNFWATWCPPCRKEIPDLISLQKTHQDLVVIGVAVDYDSIKAVADFVRKEGINYPIVLGNDAVFAQIGEMQVLPTSYLYSPKGEKAAYQEGALTKESIENYIKSKQGH